MAWKPEYEAARKAREMANPELRTKRIQSAKDSYQRRKEERKVYMQEYYKANPEKFNRSTPEQREQRNAARRKRYAEDHEWREQHKASVAQWQESNPDKRKAQRLKVFGLTLQEFNQMMESQDHRCAICGFRETIDPKLFPVVDHCHATGRVRGLLCMQCNQGLGKFKDQPRLLYAAAAYLLSHGSSGVTSTASKTHSNEPSEIERSRSEEVTR